jgi:uncharacterized protein (TIGR03437 family)
MQFVSRLFAVLSTASLLTGANLIRYDQRVAFVADTSGAQTIDFEDARQCGGFSDQFNPVNLKGVAFSGGANRGTTRGACSPILSNFQEYVFNARLFGTTTETQTLTATFPANTTSLGFDLGVSDEAVSSWTVRVTVLTNDGGEQSFDVTGAITTTQPGNQRRTTPVFVGISSSRPITSVRFRLQAIADAFIILDNITMGQTAPPVISTTRRVVNGASFREPIGPNSWITIFGQRLSGSERIWAGSDFNGNRMPTVLDDVSVTVNGRPTYAYYVNPGQLNVLTPPDLAEGPAVIEVNRGVLKSQSVTAQVARVAPGLFMFEPESSKYVAATRTDGSLVGKASLYPGSTTPAKAGDVITLWGTGFGRTDPATPIGEVPSAPLRLVATPVVTIAGATAEVLFAGLTTPGLYQLNVRVPQGVPEGDVLVRVQMEGASTQDAAFLTIGR